jgi:hypothetical protein
MAAQYLAEVLQMAWQPQRSRLAEVLTTHMRLSQQAVLLQRMARRATMMVDVVALDMTVRVLAMMEGETTAGADLDQMVVAAGLT